MSVEKMQNTKPHILFVGRLLSAYNLLTILCLCTYTKERKDISQFKSTNLVKKKKQVLKYEPYALSDKQNIFLTVVET